MHIDLARLSPDATYALMTQALVPRPIAWVISRDEERTLNLAPFSWFTAVSSDPPTILLSIGLHEDGRPKDTRRNIEIRHEFVVNIAHREMAAAMTASSAPLAPGESEIEAAGLATTDMPGSSVPRLADCRVALACRYQASQAVGRMAVIFAQVSHVWLDPAIVGEGARGRVKVDTPALDPIGRLGGGEYLGGGEVFAIERPK